MQRIVVVNPKGGSGKTTVAMNLAAQLAREGQLPALIDRDPQGSSARWIARRPARLATVHGVDGCGHSLSTTKSWQMRIPQSCRAVVVDTPAAIGAQDLPELTRGADIVLVPVMPSEIDIHTTAKCIADLLLIAKIPRDDNRIGIIANRVRANTRISHSLMRFLESLSIPIVATLRDTQNYVRAAKDGASIFELPSWQAQQDVETWMSLLEWLRAKRRCKTDRGNAGSATGPARRAVSA